MGDIKSALLSVSGPGLQFFERALLKREDGGGYRDIRSVRGVETRRPVMPRRQGAELYGFPGVADMGGEAKENRGAAFAGQYALMYVAVFIVFVAAVISAVALKSFSKRYL